MVFSQKLVQRYKELKDDVPDCLLLMQVGAFMQVMNEDARTVAQVTGLKLQMGGEVDAPVWGTSSGRTTCWSANGWWAHVLSAWPVRKTRSSNGG